jgi:uncharacterized protein YecT (DUF1311 family)
LSEEDTGQFCARVTAQPLAPPSFPRSNEAELQNCDSTALYYGIDRSPDPGAALQCAYYQRDHPDPNRGDPFAGPGVLTMLYANGKGVPRNYDLASRFACEIEASQAETHERIIHLEHLRNIHAVSSNFDLCDNVTTTLMQGACESLRQRFADAKRRNELETIKSHWPAGAQEAFKSLQDAENEFEDARIRKEVNFTGTIRAGFPLVERGRLRDQFLTNLKRFAKSDVPSTSAAAAQDVDRRLNLAYQQIQHSPADEWQNTTVNPSGIRDTQRAWLKLRDAWVEFGRLAYQTLDTTSLVAQLNRLRLHQLQSLARFHEATMK